MSNFSNFTLRKQYFLRGGTMSGMEILVIILVVLLLFGADRLPELAGTMGEA